MKLMRILTGTAILSIFGTLVLAYEYQGKKIQDRLLPVSLRVVPEQQTFKADQPILVTLELRNNFPKGALFFESFSLSPNDWNGETFNVELDALYLEGKKGSCYLRRPTLEPPITVSGFGLEEIPAQGTMKLVVDCSKWAIRDGWIPGSYVVTFRLDRIIADKYSRLSVRSEPVIINIVK